MTARMWGREAGMLALRMAIGLYVVNLGYAFEGSFKPIGEFHFVSNLFTGETLPEPEARGPKPESTNRFAGTWLGELPVPFPKNYLLGIDIQQKDFESYGRPSYLRGEWRDRGWWYYYLYAGLIKVPLGLLVLGVFSLLSAWAGRRASAASAASARDTLILLTPAVVVFCVVSSKTGFSEHFRYVLPVFPYLFVWVGGSACRFVKSAQKKVENVRGPALIGNGAVGLCRLFAPTTLLLWLATSSLWIYPHSLSYFNESVGGPLNGSGYLLGSSLDWGQNLKYAGSELHGSFRTGKVFSSSDHIRSFFRPK